MFEIKQLGVCRFDSPLKSHNVSYFVDDKERILYEPRVGLNSFKSPLEQDTDEQPISVELAGPREKIYFDPAKTRAAIVTCGGLCPGLNDVIRAIFLELYYRYNIKDVLGIRYGFAGFVKEDFKHIKLSPDIVKDIHMTSGTILGSSRGVCEVTKLVDYIEKNKINILFCIGGDGTLRGARDIAEEAMDRGYLLSVVGLPKTIDNDISHISRSFGFDTAVHAATMAVSAAHTEAKGYFNGVGLVKLMGRYSGFIASKAALAINDANYVLIPEIEFDLYGDNGFLKHLFERLRNRHHAVVIVAEGAGQYLFDQESLGYDASGNKKLGNIGLLLRREIIKYSEENSIPVTVKYIDPSYMIRSTVTVSSDGIYCIQLAQNAVHAAMAGKTNLVVGYLHGHFTCIPIDTAVSRRKRVNPKSSLWLNVLEATGQPMRMKN